MDLVIKYIGLFISSSCLVALAGNYASQRIAGAKIVDLQSLVAYGAFG